MATESVPGTLPHESPAFELAESLATMKDAAGMFEQLATLFEEISEGKANTPHIQRLAALGAYYAREHAAGQQAGLECGPHNLIDCAGLMGEASEYFDHLASLFRAIHDRAADREQAKILAEIGRYSASDFANTMDVARERAQHEAEAQA